MYWLVVFTSLVLGLQGSPIVPDRVVVAVNCGAVENEHNSIEGIKYQADGVFVKGESVNVDYGTNAELHDVEIKYALDRTLYMYERHTYKKMEYSLPVRKGKHTLILKFAEMYFNKKGQRVFNIEIGNQAIETDFDVFAQAGGKLMALEKFYEFQVIDNNVLINGVPVPGALKDKNLVLRFTRGKADNPIVNAIVIYNEPISKSPLAQFELIKKNWSRYREALNSKKEEKAIKQTMAEQRKKERIVIRNDQLFPEEEVEQVKNQKASKFGLIRSLLLGPIGIVIWAALFFLGYSKVNSIINSITQ